MVYIGQSIGPFMLPCHMACDFDDPDWKSKVGGTPQCAGAAIYRTNIGVADNLPDAIHKLPKDTATVFASPVEFLAHHARCSLAYARKLLAFYTPEEALRSEWSKFGVKLVQKRNKE
jgi:hypothetical protein